MEYENQGITISVEDSDITFESVYEKPYIPFEYIDDIKKANLLLLPEENFRQEGDILFPENTREFFEYIVGENNPSIKADITVSDEDFQRIELHSAEIDVATIIVNYVILPLAINLVSTFLYDQVKKFRRERKDTTAKVKIIVEDIKTKKSKKIYYKGPVEGINKVLKTSCKNLFNEDQNHDR